MNTIKHLLAVKSALAALVPDALVLSGAGAVTYGAWLVFAPAGFIVGGLLLVALGFAISRGGV